MALILGVAIGLVPAPAVRSVAVIGSGECPVPARVAELLGSLLEGAPANTAVIGTVSVTIYDLGSSYRVSAGGVDREIADEDRDCSERAHASAVIAMLAIAPPSVVVPAEPVQAPPAVVFDDVTNG